MKTIKLIVSDLHVASGSPLLDGFGQRQQAALEGLLSAAGSSSGSPLGEADEVELIFNGDCFDFLIVEPHDTGGVMHAGLAVEKLGRVIAAHGPFFETLHRFLSQPGRRVTFMTGHHDMELCFAEVRAGIVEAMGMKQDDGRVYFCPTPSYRPLPDVYVEHGNAYHFWCCDRSGFWDASGHGRTAHPQVMTLPLEAQYMQHVGYPVLARYPYLTRFESSLSITRQTALLCLLNRAVMVEAVQHVMELLDAGTHGPRKGLLQLGRGEACSPATLFEQAMMALAMLRETLSRVGKDGGVTEAIATICTPAASAIGDSVAAGMHTVLHSDPSLRYVLAGHTHTVRIDPIKGETAGQQVYLNTGSG